VFALAALSAHADVGVEGPYHPEHFGAVPPRPGKVGQDRRDPLRARAEPLDGLVPVRGRDGLETGVPEQGIGSDRLDGFVCGD
jgi:hypothetical protein